jgi:hypothetical protein
MERSGGIPPRILDLMTSELGKEKWAVVSDRGCEATGLTHEDARRLVHRLAGEGRHGLCIMSDEAASRMSPERREINATKIPNTI